MRPNVFTWKGHIDIFLPVCSYEEEVIEEHFLAVQDLLGLIASFTLFGKAELKVAICVNNPQPPGFMFDPTLTNGKPPW